MLIHLNIDAKCGVNLWNDDGESYEPDFEFANIDDALAYCEEQIDIQQQYLYGNVFDVYTGEILAHCSWDDKSTPEEDYGTWEDWNYNEDEGFDAYLGEYTWDC